MKMWNDAVVEYANNDGNSTKTVMALKARGYKISSSKLRQWVFEGDESRGLYPIHDMWLESIRKAQDQVMSQLTEQLKDTIDVTAAYTSVLAMKVSILAQDPAKVSNLIGQELNHVFKIQSTFMKMRSGGNTDLADLSKMSLKEASQIGQEAKAGLARHVPSDGEVEDYGLSNVIRIAPK